MGSKVTNYLYVEAELSLSEPSAAMRRFKIVIPIVPELAVPDT